MMGIRLWGRGWWSGIDVWMTSSGEDEGEEEIPQQHKENSFSSMAKEIYNERGLQGFWKG